MAALSDLAGWRYAMLPGAIVCLVCFVLVILFVRNNPVDVGLPPYGEAMLVHPQPRHAQPKALAVSFRALSEVATNRTFLILARTFFVCGLSTAGLVQNHFVPLCSDFGVASMTSSTILAVMGGFNFVGTIASGWLSDRYDNRWLLFWYYGLRGLSLLALPFTDFSVYGLTIFAIFNGLDWIATVPPTVKMANDAFGRDKGPVLFGWIFSSQQIGSAIAAYGAGASRELLLTCMPAFFSAGLVCFMAAAAILTVRRRAQLAPA